MAAVGEIERVLDRAPSQSSRSRTVGRRLTPLASADTVSPRSRATRANQSSAIARKGTRSETSEADCIPDAIAPVSPDLQTEMFVLARQTETRLLTLQRDVSECKSVDEAANFTRWLRASGVLGLLERFSCDGNMPVNGVAIRKLSESILSDCGDLYRNGKATPRYAASDIASINHKLDIIAGRMAGLSFVPCPQANQETEHLDEHPHGGGA